MTRNVILAVEIKTLLDKPHARSAACFVECDGDRAGKGEPTMSGERR